MTNSFDNEVEILQSRTLLKKVITHLGLYITTSEERFSAIRSRFTRMLPFRSICLLRRLSSWREACS